MRSPITFLFVLSSFSFISLISQRNASFPGQKNISEVSAEVIGNGWSDDPSISKDGRFITFVSVADNLVADDTNSLADIFLHDNLTGITQRISTAWDGSPPDGWSYHPTISGDGRFVAFVSVANNLTPDDTNGLADVFVYDRLTNQTSRVSLASEDYQASGWSDGPSISNNGRYLVFAS